MRASPSPPCIDEKKHEAVEFVHNAVAYYAGLGVR
jgi:hypothetical protein